MLVALFIIGWQIESRADIARQESTASWHQSGMVWQDAISQRSQADSLPDGTSAPGQGDSTGVESKKNVDEEPTWSAEEFQRHIVYPEDARRNNIQGKVIVRALIDRQGHVVKTIVQPGAHPLLIDAAVEALKKTSITPAKVNGKPVAVWIQIPVTFRLNDMAPEEDALPPAE